MNANGIHEKISAYDDDDDDVSIIENSHQIMNVHGSGFLKLPAIV